MAMQTGNYEDAITEINVTPLVDVCLVLVIIFMAVAPFAARAGIKMFQSKSGVAAGEVSSKENVRVRITRQGALLVNERPVKSGELASAIQKSLALSRDKVVIVSADHRNRVGEVVEIMDTAKQAGASKVAILKNE